jgi:hypothetical protein
LAQQSFKFRALQAGFAAAGLVLPKKFPSHSAEALVEASGTIPSPAAREGLSRLIDALDADSVLTMFGRLSVRFDCIRLLKNAQLVDDTLRVRPELAAAPVQKPIFVLGLPRSGTTFLHGLLAADPDNLVPRNWQTMFPAPRPKNFDPASDKRARTVNGQLKFFDGIAPGFADHHPVDADGPQECSEITACVFQSLRFDTTYRVPKHLAWMDAHGHDDAFVFHKKFLQILQADLPMRRWALKCPDHTFRRGPPRSRRRVRLGRAPHRNPPRAVRQKSRPAGNRHPGHRTLDRRRRTPGRLRPPARHRAGAKAESAI